jgi:hypothetical protein
LVASSALGNASALGGVTTGIAGATSQGVISKTRASKKQINVANANGRRAYAAMLGQRLPAVGERIVPDPQLRIKGLVARKKVPRYIAVETTPDKRGKGAKSVMIWDTKAQSVVGEDVYDLTTPPSPNTNIKLETYSAEYVGAGL